MRDQIHGHLLLATFLRMRNEEIEDQLMLARFNAGIRKQRPVESAVIPGAPPVFLTLDETIHQHILRVCAAYPTQGDAAAVLGLSPSAVSKWLKRIEAAK